MKIIINEEEKIILNGEELKDNQVNSEFLEKVVECGLSNELEIEIKVDENLPVSKLFLDIKNMVNPDSEFRKKLEEIEEEKKKVSESKEPESEFDS